MQRPANPSAQEVFWGMDREEVSAYVTSLPPQDATPSQIVIAYRKRADAENVFDELKNQWGFSGFCSGKAVVSETAARLILLTYNLWSLFVRVVKEQGVHTDRLLVEALYQMFPQSGVSDNYAWVRALSKVTGWSMAAKTVLSPVAQVRNNFGNILFDVAAGA